ncbi:MAG: ABC transporter ATP-binding protein [Myxococcota bacterium]
MGLWGFARKYMRPYLLWYTGGTACLVATNWMSVTIPLLLADGVDAFAAGDDGQAIILRSAVLVSLMGLAIIVVRSASRVLYFTPGRLVEAQLKRDLFERILHQQPAFLRQWPTGDLFSRVSSDVTMLRLLGGFGVLQVVNAVVALGLAGTQMAAISPALAGYVVAPICIALVIVQLYIRQIFVLMKRMQEQMAALSDHVLSSYQGIATVQGFTAEPHFETTFDHLNRTYLSTTLDRARIRALLGPTLELSASIGVFLLLYVGGPMAVADPDLTIGELVAFTTLVAFVIGPLRATSFLVSILKQAQAALERIDAILTPAPERPEGATPSLPSTTPPAIEVRDLSFAYPGAHTEALQNINLSLAPGQTLGIFGLTGSGKTTLLRVLSRLYNPPRGTVFIDGVDLLDLDLDLWRERLTFVRQRPFLYSESVRDNILLGSEDNELLTTVLHKTALRPDIDALPDGWDTLVGESGVRLSGGQRQRTALARGFARMSPVMLLDDVLSAVDHATEHELIEAMRSEAHTPTTVIVAHRISAMLHADKILVLQEGKAVDVGTPAELLSRDGIFSETWSQQQATVERAP